MFRVGSKWLKLNIFSYGSNEYKNIADVVDDIPCDVNKPMKEIEIIYLFEIYEFLFL